MPAVSLRQREIASGHLLTGIIDQGHDRATCLSAAAVAAALSGDVLRLAMATWLPQQGAPAAVFTMTNHRMST